VNSLKTFAEIDLKALSHNLRVVKEKTKSRDVLCVVKAGAYGHGSVEVSKHLLRSGASMLGVAFTEEGIELRDGGIKAPVLVFFDTINIDSYFKHFLTPVVYGFKNAKAISDKACKYRRKTAIHVKIDTGMGRVGLRVTDAFTEILKMASLKNIALEGIMSHFSDSDLTDKDFSAFQLKSFTGLIESLKKKNVYFKFCHIANSAAVLQFPEAHLNMVRPGIMLYGYGPADKKSLKPVLSLKSKIIFTKEVPAGTPVSYARTFITKRKSTLATIPVGYADGYNRKLSNIGEVIINGKRAPVRGRVCMDTIIVDITDIPHVKKDAEAVLIGSQGKEKITAQDIADKIGTIPYEVLTSIGRRVKRIYKN
jgi:alanine racemase